MAYENIIASKRELIAKLKEQLAAARERDADREHIEWLKQYIDSEESNLHMFLNP